MGKGAKYTRSFKPVEIAQTWRVFIDKSVAMKIEAYIKALSRREKEKLLGAYINARDNADFTPLVLATLNKHMESANLLQNIGA